MKRLGLSLGFVLVLTPVLFGATGTISPSPFQLILDSNGNPASLACVWTYTAGTSSPVATYTDVGLTTPNANPIIASTAGRFTAFLQPGLSYKFIYESAPCSSISHGSTILTADNIAATPTASNSIDVTGTAGEALTAGQAVYLSDGSGGKTQGSWYKADSTNTYSSTTPQVGIVPSSISSATQGTIRLVGSISGLSSLSTGSRYYISTAGTLTASPPANSRFIGQADSTTTLVLAGDPPPIAVTIPVLDDFRLSLTTATCVTTSDVTAATTLRMVPCTGTRITLADSLGNLTAYTSAEFTIGVPATTSQMYDVFVFASGTTPTLELLAWTNDTTRATALVQTTTGFLTKSGDLTRRYVGSFRTTTVSGQTEDSTTKRYVWNYYNRVRRKLQRNENNNSSWTYSTATFRQANNSASNQVDTVIGVVEHPIELMLSVTVKNDTGSLTVQTGIQQDATNSLDQTNTFGGQITIVTASAVYNLQATYVLTPTAGRHFYAWIEWSAATGVTTWNTNNGANNVGNGLHGWIEG